MTRLAFVGAALVVVSLTGCGPAPGPLVSCPDAGTTLTYANFGKDFMNVYCVACHAGARIEKVDLSTAAKVAASGAKVITTAGTGMSMPESGPMPTVAERAQLAEWVSCGAP